MHQIGVPARKTGLGKAVLLHPLGSIIDEIFNHLSRIETNGQQFLFWRKVLTKPLIAITLKITNVCTEVN